MAAYNIRSRLVVSIVVISIAFAIAPEMAQPRIRPGFDLVSAQQDQGSGQKSAAEAEHLYLNRGLIEAASHVDAPGGDPQSSGAAPLAALESAPRSGLPGHGPAPSHSDQHDTAAS